MYQKWMQNKLIFPCLLKSDALISDLMVSIVLVLLPGMQERIFNWANHPENSTNEIQVIQAKIIIDLKNRLVRAALLRRP